MLIVLSGSGALSYALAKDILEVSTLSRGLSWLKGTSSSASVVSFALTGLLMDNLGPITLYVTATILSIAAAYLLEAIGCRPKKLVPIPSGLSNDFFCM